MAMICPKCQSDIENPKVMYCPTCGTQLRRIPERTVASSTAPKQLLPIIIGTAAVVAVIILVLIIGYLFSQNFHSEETSDELEIVYEPLETDMPIPEPGVVTTMTTAIEPEIFTEPEIRTEIIVVTETIYVGGQDDSESEGFVSDDGQMEPREQQQPV